MSAGIDVLRVSLHRGTVARLRLVELALLKVDVAQLRVVMWFVEMMNLRLQFLDALSMAGTGEFKPAGRGRLAAENMEEIPQRREAWDQDKKGDPHPLLPTDRVDQHPELKQTKQDGARCSQQFPNTRSTGNERKNHGRTVARL